MFSRILKFNKNFSNNYYKFTDDTPFCNKYIKNYLVCALLFSFYGFTRGYRSKYYINNSNKQELFTDKLSNAFICAIFYALPMLNLIFMKQLVSRIEGKFKGYKYDNDDNNYSKNFKEMPGFYCKDII
jgi:hypothetical protein